MTRLPAACSGKASRATIVTKPGYRIPVTTVSSPKTTSAGRSSRIMLLTSGPSGRRQQNVDRLDADERHGDAAEAVDQEVAAQQHRRGRRASLDAPQCQR